MGTIERFEDIEAWRDARELVRNVYEITSQGRFERDFGLRDQLRRAAVSTMSNIAEGFERGGNREFIRFLYFAKGSAGEVRSQLYVAVDLDYVDQQEANEISERVQTISRRVSSLIKYLKSNPTRESASRQQRPKTNETQ